MQKWETVAKAARVPTAEHVSAVLTHQLAPRQITGNCVAPGWVDTEMAAQGMQQGADATGDTFEQFRERTGHTILERYGMSEALGPMVDRACARAKPPREEVVARVEGALNPPPQGQQLQPIRWTLGVALGRPPGSGRTLPTRRPHLVSMISLPVGVART